MAALFALCLLPKTTYAQATARTELIVWGIGYGPDSKGLEAVVREFERRNPTIKVRLLTMGAGTMNPQKLMTAIVGKVPPDVVHQDRFTVSDWASRGAFRPLSDLIDRDKDKDPEGTPTADKFYPAAWNEGSYQGKVYGIPTGADNRVLYWNRAMFRNKAKELTAAGLDPERAPRTWSELLAYSKILTERKPDGSLIRAGFIPNYGNSWLYMFAFQNNASFLSPDGKTCTLAEPNAVEALQFVVDGYDIIGGYEKAKAFETGFLSGLNDPFVTGKVAMKIDGDWILGDTLARYGPGTPFATAPPPVPDDRFYRRGRFANEKDTFVTWLGGFCYVIPSGARHVDEGWKFIKWATSKEALVMQNLAQREWERQRGRTYIPRQQGNAVANEELFRILRPADPKFAQALRQHVDLMPVGRIRPATFVAQRLWDEHVKALETAAFKKMTPKDALMVGQVAVQRELDDYAQTFEHPLINMQLPLYLALGLGGALLIWAWLAFRRLNLKTLARQEALWGYALIAPWFIGFVAFVFGPMIASLFFSFTQYNVLSDARWVGMKNFNALFTSDASNIAKSLTNVGYLAAIGVPLSLFTGLAIALLLNAAVRGMKFYRTMFYMPAIVPGVASAVLWVWLLTPDANKGLINAGWMATLTQWLGMATPGWLNSEAWSKNSLILMGAWGAGGGMILWLAGLKGISTTLYEAANIDGASAKQQFWSITLPQLSPIIFFNTVMGFIGALQEFDRVYIMMPPNGGVGPADSLLVPVYHLFRNGFAYFSMGYASALAWLIFAIILAITFMQFKLAPRWVHYEAEK
ncbi:MAG: extracellular solute-binding protein [Fimbriimonas sp.]